MILFSEDYEKEPVYTHLETSNSSFIRMSIVLKRMGIKNHNFFLALKQPSLRNVDPHSPHLDLETKLKILVEVKTNPWYYFREVLKIPASGDVPVPFELHRANLAAIWTYLNDIDFGLVQPRQSGKFLRNTELIRIPGGWKPMGDLRVGDTVTAWDGTPSKITGVYPQGKQEIYRVYFLDGRWVDAGKDHLWTIIKPANRGGYTTDTVTTFEIMQRVIRDEGKGDFMSTFIPLNQSEQISDVELPLHPYILGALLGDGNLSATTPMSITTDQEIIDRIETLLPKGVRIRKSLHRNGFTGIGTFAKTEYGKGLNPIVTILRDLGLLGCNSYTKFIPEIYLNASHNQRMELMRGLMDTDGYAGRHGQLVEGKRQKKNSSNEYSTSSKQLALDVQLLTRSFGAICKMTERTPVYTYKGEHKTGATNYRMYIRYPWMSDLFWLPRKKEHMQDENRNITSRKLRVTSVVPLPGKEECTCIAIDHPDKLYVTKDYIVTHNTFVTQSIVSHYMYVYADNVDIGMITKDTPLVQDNVKRLKELRDTLPSYVVTRSTKDWDRKEGISYALKNNFYKTYTAPIDERSAYNVGRGNKFAILHYDEIAYLRYNQIIVSTTANSMLAASEQVRKAGLPSISIYTTTAGNPDTKEGAFALALLRDGLEFTEAFYDLKNRNALMEIMKTSARANLMYIEFSYRQLGKSDEWFRNACVKSKGSQDDINRDLLNIWQAASDRAVIEQHYITKIRESKIDPAFIDTNDGFLVKWYLPKSTVETQEFINRPLIMGMDTSENVERDYTTFAIVDPRDMRLVATCRCNDVNLMTVAAHIAKFLMKYSRLVWIPERNNTGSGIIDFVIGDLQKAGINPFFRIFNMAVHERSEPKYEKIDLYNYKEIHGAVRSVFGYRTAGASASTARNMLYKSTLKKAVEMNSTRICDNVLINEMCSLTVRGGRVDHPVGGHDDTVIAYLLACFMIYFGNNLNMYGIPISSVLVSIDTNGKEVDPTFKTEQLLIRKKVSELEQLLLANPGSMLKFGYERELRKLRNLIDDTAINIQPIAVAQISHQESIYKAQTGTSAESRIQNFVTRFNNAR